MLNSAPTEQDLAPTSQFSVSDRDILGEGSCRTTLFDLFIEQNYYTKHLGGECGTYSVAGGSYQNCFY